MEFGKITYNLKISDKKRMDDEISVSIDVSDYFDSGLIFGSYIRFLQRIGLPEEDALEGITEFLEGYYNISDDPDTPSVKPSEVDNSPEARRKFLESLKTNPALLEEVYLMYLESLLGE
jgi:hypothetical protein